MTQTSGSPSVPSTGMRATRAIQSCTMSVMWGTTCTVLPRYSPWRSFSITACGGAAQSGVKTFQAKGGNGARRAATPPRPPRAW